jgi:hypothetical protein
MLCLRRNNAVLKNYRETGGSSNQPERLAVERGRPATTRKIWVKNRAFRGYRA